MEAGASTTAHTEADAALGPVVGADLNLDLVALDDGDLVLLHLAVEVAENDRPIRNAHLVETTTSEVFNNPFKFDDVLLRHNTPKMPGCPTKTPDPTGRQIKLWFRNSYAIWFDSSILLDGSADPAHVGRMATCIDIECAGQEWNELPDAMKAMALKAKSKVDPNRKVNEEEAIESLALSPYTGVVTVISLWDTYNCRGLTFYVNDSAIEALPEAGDDEVLYRFCQTEKELLSRVWKALMKLKQKQIVTYNGARFDLPYMMVRSLANAVTVPWHIVNQKRYEDNHIDVSDVLEVYGVARFPANLDSLCVLMGVASPKEGGISGKDAPVLWKEGKKEVVIRYCGRDTKQLGQVAVALHERGVIDLWSDTNHRRAAKEAEEAAKKAAEKVSAAEECAPSEED